eukprot:m.431650 g.431650  ORF g.431650 m.431650 type:complete len:486 (+) comp17332_c0_seq1:188-1645(+)
MSWQERSPSLRHGPSQSDARSAICNIVVDELVDRTERLAVGILLGQLPHVSGLLHLEVLCRTTRRTNRQRVRILASGRLADHEITVHTRGELGFTRLPRDGVKVPRLLLQRRCGWRGVCCCRGGWWLVRLGSGWLVWLGNRGLGRSNGGLVRLGGGWLRLLRLLTVRLCSGLSPLLGGWLRRGSPVARHANHDGPLNCFLFRVKSLLLLGLGFFNVGHQLSNLGFCGIHVRFGSGSRRLFLLQGALAHHQLRLGVGDVIFPGRNFVSDLVELSPVSRRLQRHLFTRLCESHHLVCQVGLLRLKVDFGCRNSNHDAMSERDVDVTPLILIHIIHNGLGKSLLGKLVGVLVQVHTSLLRDGRQPCRELALCNRRDHRVTGNVLHIESETRQICCLLHTIVTIDPQPLRWWPTSAKTLIWTLSRASQLATPLELEDQPHLPLTLRPLRVSNYARVYRLPSGLHPTLDAQDLTPPVTAAVQGEGIAKER